MKFRSTKAVFWVLFVLIVPQLSFAGTFRDDFEDGDLAGWKPNAATGISVVDGQLQFKGTDRLILKLGESSWENYSFESRLNVCEFAAGGSFSLRVMQSSEGDHSGYYELSLSSSGTTAALYLENRCVESFRSDTFVEENKWYNLRVELDGEKISFYFDDVLVARLTEVELSGYLDMCSTKGTHVYIDEVVISGKNIPETGESGINSPAEGENLKFAVTWGEIKSIGDN